MIHEPLNDKECLGQLTAVAAEGVAKPEVRVLATRFATTKQLAKWIRHLPQRDDDGDPNDGPRVACDVTQRARLAPGDPNCVERAILYVATAEVIDPTAIRQLATMDVSDTLRHTFPLEDGEPVVLDPTIRRNALRAGLWRIRNGSGGPDGFDLAGLDPAGLLEWLTALAEDAAEEESGEHGRARVARARWALAALLDGRAITPRDRADVLYALRLAGDVSDWFGDAGIEGYRVARAFVARLVARGTVGARRAARNVSLQRIGYWSGKAVATYYGLGGVYDAAYAEVMRRPGGGARAPPKATTVTVAATPATSTPPSSTASEAPMVGTLEELEPKKGE